MLEVRGVRPLRDGRRIVSAVGSRRFRCVRKGVRDGYNTASVEYLRDRPVPEGGALGELRLLHDAVRLRAQRWFRSIDADTRRRILAHYGPMPDVESEFWARPDGPEWLWWLVAILPLEAAAQGRLVRECSLRARLSRLSQVLRCVVLHQRGAAPGPAAAGGPALLQAPKRPS